MPTLPSATLSLFSTSRFQCSRRLLWLGIDVTLFSPKLLHIILHYRALLFSCLEFECQVPSPNVDPNLSSSNINSCTNITEKCSPENEWHFTIILHIKDHEICEEMRTLDIHQ
jgi:hypothetical protein